MCYTKVYVMWSGLGLPIPVLYAIKFGLYSLPLTYPHNLKKPPGNLIHAQEKPATQVCLQMQTPIGCIIP